MRSHFGSWSIVDASSIAHGYAPADGPPLSYFDPTPEVRRMLAAPVRAASPYRAGRPITKGEGTDMGKKSAPPKRGGKRGC